MAVGCRMYPTDTPTFFVSWLHVECFICLAVTHSRLLHLIINVDLLLEGQIRLRIIKFFNFIYNIMLCLYEVECQQPLVGRLCPTV